MKTIFKILIWVAVIAIIFYAIYRYAKKVSDNINFDTNFRNVDLQTIFTSGSATVDLTISIDNKNGFEIPVGSFYTEVYYGGQIIGRSTNVQDFVVPANDKLDLIHNMTVVVDNRAIEIVGKLIKKEPLNFTYKISGRLWGFIPAWYNGSFSYSR